MPKLGMQPIRRRQLIQATLEAIDELGLADATIARIAKRAGVSTGIISHYFAGKDGLLALGAGGWRARGWARACCWQKTSGCELENLVV